jgi:hypothetical protein
MGFPDDYPHGGAAGYYEHLHSDNLDLVRQADIYRWNHPDASPDVPSGPSGISSSPDGPEASMISQMLRETTRVPALFVWAGVLLAIHFLHLWNGLHTTGAQLNGITTLAIAALLITTPIGRRLGLGCAVILIVLFVGIALLSRACSPRPAAVTESRQAAPPAAPRKGKAASSGKKVKHGYAK